MLSSLRNDHLYLHQTTGVSLYFLEHKYKIHLSFDTDLSDIFKILFEEIDEMHFLGQYFTDKILPNNFSRKLSFVREI